MNGPQEADVVIVPASQRDGRKLTHWYVSLEEEMTKRGLRVLRPDFPGGTDQTFGNWMGVLKRHEHEIGPTTIAVGHSLGGLLVARFLEIHQVGAAIFVAAPYKEEAQLWAAVANKPEATSGFWPHELDWKRIRAHARMIRLIYGDDDLLIPHDHAETYSRELGCEITWIPHGGHLDEYSHYLQFPLLAEQILSLHKELLRGVQEGKPKGYLV